MKKITVFHPPKSRHLIYLLFIFFSIQSFAAKKNGNINGFEFTNGQQTISLDNGKEYNLNELPTNFYINLIVNGYSQSVRYKVENLDNGKTYKNTESFLPYTFPSGNTPWKLGVGNFKITAYLNKFDFGFGKIDSKTVTFKINNCTANAGTLKATAESATLANGKAVVEALPNGGINVPLGYSSLFVLTSGTGLVIEQVAASPKFTVDAPGLYTIHTLVYDADPKSPNFLDLGVVVPGTTTGVDVLNIVANNGICASLDAAGAPVTVKECSANAGTLKAIAESATLANGKAVVEALPNGGINVPLGYSSLFVLTSGTGLVIEQVAASPKFTVGAPGLYTIHTLVYDADPKSPNFLDLGVVVPGTTTGVDVLNIVANNGICASLDAAGAPVTVKECSANAGTLKATAESATLANGKAVVEALPNGGINVPLGYSSLFVLTSGTGLVIEQVAASPKFTVGAPGLYTIHTLVYDADPKSPNFLDLGVVVPGTTTGVDVLNIVANNGICASLDAAGAPVTVYEDKCTAFSGGLYSMNPISCLYNGKTIISAKTNANPVVPKNYKQLFVLTEAFSLKILAVSDVAEFEVGNAGFYRIHSLVYNPMTLDLSVVVPGQTTGFDVVNIIKKNNICASLDVYGAPNLVIGSKWFCYFFNRYSKNQNMAYKGSNSKYNNDGALNGILNKYDSYEAFKTDFINSNSQSNLFPNPVSNALSINMEVFDDEVVNYSIIDLSGRTVLRGLAKDLSLGTQKINANTLNSGMYLVKLESKYRSITKKIIVKK